MTWGQIRFQLMQSNPGVSLDLLDGWLNARYEQILESSDWTGIHARGTIVTVVDTSIYTLPPDCSTVERIMDPLTGYPLVEFTAGEMDQSAGLRTVPGSNPQLFRVIEDEAEVAQQTSLHQIEFVPTPIAVLTYTVEYLRSAFGFDGATDLSSSPLSFISSSILLSGVRADIALAAGKVGPAQLYEAQFKTELLRLLQVEHSQRRAYPTIRMAGRFTRHRMDRVLRGYQKHPF